MVFKVGDKVTPISDGDDWILAAGYSAGDVLTILDIREPGLREECLKFVELQGEHPGHWRYAYKFELVAESPASSAMHLSTDPAERKGTPITTGVLDYFPLALAEVAKCSKAGNDQHNPGQPLHWAKEKSTDHPDCIARHLIDRGTVDTDGIRHSAKLAWRALALLQIELEAARANS